MRLQCFLVDAGRFLVSFTAGTTRCTGEALDDHKSPPQKRRECLGLKTKNGRDGPYLLTRRREKGLPPGIHASRHGRLRLDLFVDYMF